MRELIERLEVLVESKIGAEQAVERFKALESYLETGVILFKEISVKDSNTIKLFFTGGRSRDNMYKLIDIHNFSEILDPNNKRSNHVVGLKKFIELLELIEYMKKRNIDIF